MAGDYQYCEEAEYQVFSEYSGPSTRRVDIDGLAQDCSNSIANALELLQPCVKQSICI